MKRILTIAGLFMAATTSSNAELQIIGTGYGRTGTDTLREALTTLGYKTYHMKEILIGKMHQDILDWKTLLESDHICRDTNLLKEIFERGKWTAALDFPAVLCWEKLIEIYPNAKVIHTERTSAEKWYESASSTILIGRTMFPFNILKRIVPFWMDHRDMVNTLWSRVIGTSVSEMDTGWPNVYKSELMKGYEENNARVRELVPTERLLIQSHSEGWKKLTVFLGKDIPKELYPHSNTREDFIIMFRQIGHHAAGTVLVCFFVIAFMIRMLIWVYAGGKKKKVD